MTTLADLTAGVTLATLAAGRVLSVLATQTTGESRLYLAGRCDGLSVAGRFDLDV